VGITISKRQILNILCALSIACIFMLSACSGGAAVAKEGDTVKVLYVGTYDNGSVFDSSELHGGDPLQFSIGAQGILPGFQQAVIGLAKGKSINTNISAEDGYGTVQIVYDLDPELETPVVGQQYQLQLSNGVIVPAIAINVSNTSVTFLNMHQLAGENLHFEITLVEIVSAE